MSAKIIYITDGMGEVLRKEQKWEENEMIVKRVAGVSLIVLLLMPQIFLHIGVGEKVVGALAGKAPPYGGVLKIGFQSDLKSLNPCMANDIWSWYVLGLIYEPLSVPSKGTEKPIPWIAESCTMDTPDGLNWTVKIRQGIKWHDGMPLTADDVVFSYNFYSEQYSCGHMLQYIDWTPIPNATDKNETYYRGVQKVDMYTVKFVLWKEYPFFLSHYLSYPILPKHIWRKHWLDFLHWNMDYNPTTGTANVIGSGPFKFAYWKRGVEVKVERNPDYFWDTVIEDCRRYKVPFVDAIQFIVYKNMDRMVSALKKGAIDFICGSIDPGWLSKVSQTLAGYGDALARISAVTTMNVAMQVIPPAINGREGQTATGNATYATLSATATGTLEVRGVGTGENISVSLALSTSEVDGIAGAELFATVRVLNGTVPMQDVNVSLQLTPSTGLSAEPFKKTDANGTAKIKITVSQDFSLDTIVVVKAIAVVNNTSYESIQTVLKVKYVPYKIRLNLEKTEIVGKKGTEVKAVVVVERNDVGIKGLNVSVAFDKSGLGATNGTTDENGSVTLTITVVEDVREDVVIKVIPKVEGVNYLESAAELRVMRMPQKTPGFEVELLIGALIAVASILFVRRRQV